MNKIALIIQREYLTRVKKKSFVIMTLVGPILLAAIFIVPVWLAIQSEEVQKIEVVDETGLFINQIKNTDNLIFDYQFRTISEAQKNLITDDELSAVLYIPEVVVSVPNTVQVFYKNQPASGSIGYMENSIAEIIENKKLEDQYNLSLNDISTLKPDIKIVSSKLTEEGFEKSAGGLATGVGFAAAFFIYLFIFLYGVQVMRGVIEEKTNRIVEVIISSVKPFQLMMGKILGIAMVGVTQFLLWVILTGALIVGAQSFFEQDLISSRVSQNQQIEEFNPNINQPKQSKEQDLIAELNTNIQRINFPLILACFLFYFLGGYFLYGALFAAIGSAVDNETDTQQFMLPITIPLIFSFVIAQLAMENPDGSMAFWASIIPLTSPIVMMVRIPGGVPVWELLLSMAALILTFLATTWLAGRIYRTGILMYGKKVSFKELGKWLFYKV